MLCVRQARKKVKQLYGFGKCRKGISGSGNKRTAKSRSKATGSDKETTGGSGKNSSRKMKLQQNNSRIPRMKLIMKNKTAHRRDLYIGHRMVENIMQALVVVLEKIKNDYTGNCGGSKAAGKDALCKVCGH